MLGLVVYGCGAVARQLPGMSEIECFVSSFVATFVATALDKYVYDEKLCLYGQLFGGIVWLLPGITITIAVLELYSNMIVYGSSRLIYGIFLASQMGFGLIGEQCYATVCLRMQVTRARDWPRVVIQYISHVV